MKTTKVKNKVNNSLCGQALVSLMIFMAVAMAVTSAAVIVSFVNSQSTSNYADGEAAFAFGESGLENAVLKLTKNSNYIGETISVDYDIPTSVIINITGASTKTINVSVQMAGLVRNFQAIGSFSGKVFNLTSWQEVP